VQLGQDRGGFYSYERLENLADLGIYSTDIVRIRPPGSSPGSRNLGRSPAMRPSTIQLMIPTVFFPPSAYTVSLGRFLSTRSATRG
jgi:hypothetical protein